MTRWTRLFGWTAICMGRGKKSPRTSKNNECIPLYPILVRVFEILVFSLTGAKTELWLFPFFYVAVADVDHTLRSDLCVNLSEWQRRSELTWPDRSFTRATFVFNINLSIKRASAQLVLVLEPFSRGSGTAKCHGLTPARHRQFGSFSWPLR
jgi:hypothetical protein